MLRRAKSRSVVAIVGVAVATVCLLALYSCALRCSVPARVCGYVWLCVLLPALALTASVVCVQQPSPSCPAIRSSHKLHHPELVLCHHRTRQRTPSPTHPGYGISPRVHPCQQCIAVACDLTELPAIHDSLNRRAC